MESERIKNLREALQFSPGNIPLVMHLALELMNEGNEAAALIEYKKILDIDSNNIGSKFGMAKAHYGLGNYSTSAVILEELCSNSAVIEHFVLLAKVNLKENSLAEAQAAYQKVLEIDATYSDEELDEKLRRQETSQEKDFEDEDDIESRLMEKPNINFDDVGGMERVKREIDLKIIQPLKNIDLYKAYGKKVGGGILLYGPPGCGKTHLARATAGQINAKFINVGINEVLDMWIGNSEKNLHEIFEYARKNKPCVLFFDEIDAIGASRSDMKQSSGRHLINQFLAELDGLESDNDGLLILGATNTPWNLDSAFRRPGRFDRIIFVEPPNTESKATILKILLKDKPKGEIDYEAVAKKAKDYSGADLTAAIDIATEEKIEEAMKTGNIEPIRTKDLTKAVKKHRASTKEWFTSAKNYALYANDSGLYDDILNYLDIKK